MHSWRPFLYTTSLPRPLKSLAFREIDAFYPITV